MAVKVPTIDTGIATAGISVARRLPRNTKMTMITSPKAMASEIATSRIESLMNREES